MQLSPVDAIVVFGPELDAETRGFQPFVYQQIDLAVQLHNVGMAQCLVFGGGYGSPEEGKQSQGELMQQYALNTYRHLPKVRSGLFLATEGCDLLEKWLLLRLKYPRFHRMIQISVPDLKSRSMRVAWKVFGNYAKVQCVTIPGATGDFPDEPRLIEEIECLLKPIEAGDLGHWVAPTDGRLLIPEIYARHAGCTKHSQK